MQLQLLVPPQLTQLPLLLALVVMTGLPLLLLLPMKLQTLLVPLLLPLMLQLSIGQLLGLARGGLLLPHLHQASQQSQR